MVKLFPYSVYRLIKSMSFNGQWKRFGCCPNNQAEFPSQHIIVFEMTGYNYRTIPEWFDSMGQKIHPLQFSILYDKLYYRWTFYKKDKDSQKNIYHVSTSDDIVPVIFDAITNEEMKVTRISRHNGYTIWQIKH